MEKLGPCPAAMDVTCDGINGGENAGRLCWAVAGTSCAERLRGKPGQGTASCQECSFFRRVKYEEGCHFQLIKPALGILDVEVLHRRLNETVMLLTLYRDIFACLAERPLLERITKRAVAATNCSAAGAYLICDSPRRLSLEASAGPRALPHSVSLDDGSPIASALRRRSLCSATVALPGRPEATSMIATPIGGEQGPIGALALVRKGGEFSADDEWFLGEFAIMAGLGIGNSRLIESLRDLRRVDKATSRAVTLLLHQIASPLATITCSLMVLLRHSESLDQADHTRLLECSLERANSIMLLSKKLLELAAIRSAKRLADIQPVCVSNILREEIEARRVQAQQEALEIIPHLQDEQAVVEADPDGLRLIFGNLLDNAIKYSAGKGKEIDVSLQTNRNRLCICFHDKGIGIPVDEQRRLFEEFHRAANVVGSGAEGFGLGLAFAKELVDRYNGRIELESEVGVGTSVTVEFPLLPSPAPGGNT